MFLTFHQILKVRMACALFYNILEDCARKTLFKGNRAAFDEYVRACVDLSDMACVGDFVAGHSSGARVMPEVLCKDWLNSE